MADVSIWGEEVESGAYVLRIRVERPLSVIFGRYQGGRPVPVPAGHLLYVGSAMGSKGSTTLARRLMRHVTRSGGRPPHPVRASLLRRFRQIGLGPDNLAPPSTKRLHWHVDFLLDEPAVTVDAVLVVRSSNREEEVLARFLARSQYTAELSPGLGATDAPGQTHLLRLHHGERGWQELLHSLREEGLDYQDDGDPRSQDQ